MINTKNILTEIIEYLTKSPDSKIGKNMPQNQKKLAPTPILPSKLENRYFDYFEYLCFLLGDSHGNSIGTFVVNAIAEKTQTLEKLMVSKKYDVDYSSVIDADRRLENLATKLHGFLGTEDNRRHYKLHFSSKLPVLNRHSVNSLNSSLQKIHSIIEKRLMDKVNNFNFPGQQEELSSKLFKDLITLVRFQCLKSISVHLKKLTDDLAVENLTDLQTLTEKTLPVVLCELKAFDRLSELYTLVDKYKDLETRKGSILERQVLLDQQKLFLERQRHQLIQQSIVSPMMFSCNENTAYNNRPSISPINFISSSTNKPYNGFFSQDGKAAPKIW